MPSEFSTNIENSLSKKLPIVTHKIEIREYVESLANEGKIEWSSVNNGPFLSKFIFLSGWIGPNPSTGTVLFHDDGNAIVTTSTLERIGEGVAASLHHPEITRNKPVYVYSTAFSERKVASVFTRLTGKQLKESTVKIDDIVREADEARAKGDMSKTMNYYVPFCYGDGYGGDFRSIAMNKELGLPEMTEQEVEALFGSWLEQ